MTVALVSVFPAPENPHDLLPELRAGQIVENIGEFRFPRGKRTLQLSEDDNGNVHIAVYVQSSAVWCIPFTKIPYRTRLLNHIEHRVIFESERHWFATVDQYDRLWIYYGCWDKQWGKLRQLPSGGTRPYSPAVIRHGLSLLPNGSITPLDGRIIDDTGDWVGVPKKFLHHVQKAMESETDYQPVIPAKAPAFTPEQHNQLTQWLKQSG